MGNHGWRPHIESALCLSLPRLLKLGHVAAGCIRSGVLEWSQDGELVARVRYCADLGDAAGTLTLAYRDDGRDAQDSIPLSTIPNHYGGRNWFMHCPVTGRRARKLYKWPGLSHFCHREAVRPRPTYASQRDSGISRVNRQRWALRHRLGDQWSDLFEEPIKPKWMRRRTFERYSSRDAELERREGPHWATLFSRLGLDLEGGS